MGEGPTVLLANGLGGTFRAWQSIAERLADRFRVVSWDYRGTHGSDRPADRRAITVAHHAADAAALLDHLGVRRALFVGWSLGVQVGFELYRTRPELFAGIAALSGTAGKAFASVRARLATRLATDLTLTLLRRSGPLPGVVLRAASRSTRLLRFAKRVGLVSATLDDELFLDLVRHFARLDFSLYAELLTALDEHDAWETLPRVRVPVTVVTGGRDFMTPASVAERMRQLIPDCRLVLIPTCTHYAAAESPAEITAALDELVGRCGADAWRDQAARSFSASPLR